MLRSSIYTLNNTGDTIPPCFSPAVTGNEEETVLPHLPLICCCEYQNTNNLITNKDTRLSISLVKRRQ